MSKLFSGPLGRFQDEFFMRRALKLAFRAAGRTSPNPMVGAVVVKNGKILGQGYHHQAGKDHAEVEALKQFRPSQLKGAILYVTLEPCCHFGKTPPCTKFLIKKGIKRIVVAMRDPNPLVAGKGIRELKRAGVKVEVGILREEAEKLNEAFIFGLKQQKPFVILKTASTLDGKMALPGGISKWITNEKSRRYVHRLRNQADAILTTSKTVLADDPHLGVRMVKGRDPLRVVLDSDLKTPLKARVYRDSNVVVATCLAAGRRRKAFEQAGVELLIYQGSSHGAQISLPALFHDLYAKGVRSVLVEAGSTLVTSLLRQKLVQKGYFFIAPKVFGAGLAVVEDLGIRKMKDAPVLKNVEHHLMDDDSLFIGYF